MTPEELAEKKKAQIESEFKRYKLISELRARKAKKQKEEDEAAKLLEGENKDEIEEQKEPEMEIKLAAKARKKFQKIDASGRSGVSVPKNQQKGASKWEVKMMKTDGPAPEIVNRQKMEESDEEEEGMDISMDVKNRAEKWAKKMEMEGEKGRKKKKKKLAEGNEGGEELARKAKELREHFEKITQMLILEDLNAEKRKELQEELFRMRAEKEELEKEEQNLIKSEEIGRKEDIQIAAKHASKMTNKWEKILQKKEKEANRTKLVPKDMKPPSKWSVKKNEPAEIVNRPNYSERKSVEREDESREGNAAINLKEEREKGGNGEIKSSANFVIPPAKLTPSENKQQKREEEKNGKEKDSGEEKEDFEEEEEEENEDEEEWEYEYVDEEEEEIEEMEQIEKKPPPPPPKPKTAN